MATAHNGPAHLRCRIACPSYPEGVAVSSRGCNPRIGFVFVFRAPAGASVDHHGRPSPLSGLQIPSDAIRGFCRLRLRHPRLLTCTTSWFGRHRPILSLSNGTKPGNWVVGSSVRVKSGLSISLTGCRGRAPVRREHGAWTSRGLLGRCQDENANAGYTPVVAEIGTSVVGTTGYPGGPAARGSCGRPRSLLTKISVPITRLRVHESSCLTI